MRKESLNGIPIPYDLPLDELKEMLAPSHTMKYFSLACEALSCHGSPEAYEIMKARIADRDIHRRLYILKTIFRYPQASELAGFLEEFVSSEDLSLAQSGLRVISEYRVKISERILPDAIIRHLPRLWSGALWGLETLSVSEKITVS